MSRRERGSHLAVRYDSNLLSDELRQPDVDLTRFPRTNEGLKILKHLFWIICCAALWLALTTPLASAQVDDHVTRAQPVQDKRICKVCAYSLWTITRPTSASWSVSLLHGECSPPAYRAGLRP